MRDNGGIFLTRQEVEKMSNITTQPALWQHVQSIWGRIGGSLPYINWIILVCRETWPNKGDLHGNVGFWKSVEEVQQILRELKAR